MRKSTGKRTRFEVFKRDHFTCQYCGAQPPDVVLVVDHIEPVCAGGENGIENLITSCEACNQGKAGKTLSNVPIRPDADLLYLETQQEISELRRYQLAKTERDAILSELVETMIATWCSISDHWYGRPDSPTILSMLKKYPPEIVEYGLTAAANAVRVGRVSRGEGVRYAWGVMRHASEES